MNEPKYTEAYKKVLAKREYVLTAPYNELTKLERSLRDMLWENMFESERIKYPKYFQLAEAAKRVEANRQRILDTPDSELNRLERLFKSTIEGVLV